MGSTSSQNTWVAYTNCLKTGAHHLLTLVLRSAYGASARSKLLANTDLLYAQLVMYTCIACLSRTTAGAHMTGQAVKRKKQPLC